MKKVSLYLNKSELYMLDHALRDRLARKSADEKDVYFENVLLNKVNDGIRKIKEVRANVEREKEN